MGFYGELCSRTLARAHARSGDRVAIASYLGAKDVFDRAIAEFADSTPTRPNAITTQLIAAEQDGRITVRRGL